METLKFKTNINCSGCVAKVTPFLNEGNKIAHWNVDTTNPDKILIVETSVLSSDEIEERIIRSGYKIARIWKSSENISKK